MDDLHVIFTMDVERIAKQSPSGGPRTWEICKESVRTFLKALDEHGYLSTLFIVPDVVSEQRVFFKRVLSTKHECGMHFHPVSWHDNYLNKEDHYRFGCYSVSQQETFLKQALEEYKKALNYTPVSFRPGYFSLNNDSYSILEKLGFLGGSTSFPGRNMKRNCALWRGKRRDVHRTHPGNRLIAGDLNFVDVPVTSRVDVLGYNQLFFKHGDIRFERLDIADGPKHFVLACKQSLRWQFKHHSPVKHLCFFTHNLYKYSESSLSPEVPGDFKDLTSVIQSVFTALPEIARSFSLRIKPSTVRDLSRKVLEFDGLG
ncbi:MAG: polysaccharide deacetylase family protein [Promethearchaeota archaeon]